MGRHVGDGAQSSYAAPSLPWRRILVLGLLVTLMLVAWGVLVHAAIDFGGQVRSGAATSWVFLALASTGAAACLFVMLLLSTRIISLVQGRQAPVRPRGGRRIAR